MANVTDKFRGLPIEDLIAAPLKAVSDSQKQLALSVYEYIMQVGFDIKEIATDDKGGTEKSYSPRVIKLELDRPLKEGGVTKIGVQAPFLGLVPVPAILVNEVNINFQMEVTDTETIKTNTAGSVETDVNGSYGFLFAKTQVKVAGKVSSSRESTRSTNQTAKYQVSVIARQQQPTEGMSKLMDIISSCVEERIDKKES